VHAPPTFYLYHLAWGLLAVGVCFLAVAPFQRSWQLLAFGVGSLFLAVPVMAVGAVWRDSYNEQSDDEGLTDHQGFPVSRVELATDVLGTWIVRQVWSGFRAKGGGGS
jgi:hypothetical protein